MSMAKEHCTIAGAHGWSGTVSYIGSIDVLRGMLCVSTGSIAIPVIKMAQPPNARSLHAVEPASRWLEKTSDVDAYEGFVINRSIS